MNVTVYSTPVCPYCDMAKDFLKQHSIPFREYDVSANPHGARELMLKSGQTGVPVIEINGRIIVGFDPAAILEALGIKD